MISQQNGQLAYSINNNISCAKVQNTIIMMQSYMYYSKNLILSSVL